MSIDSLKVGLQGLKPIQRPAQQIQNVKNSTGGEQDGFKEIFTDAIKEVDEMQKVADTKIEGLILNKGDVTPHDAMIALEKADVAFQLMNQIRSKIVRAYEEIMRTQL